MGSGPENQKDEGAMGGLGHNPVEQAGNVTAPQTVVPASGVDQPPCSAFGKHPNVWALNVPQACWLATPYLKSGSL